MKEIEIYAGQEFHVVRLFGLERRLPVVNVGGGVWIASDAELVLGDTEFIAAAARKIAEMVKPYAPEVVVTAEAKSIALAYELSRALGHRRFVTARKSVKAYMGSCLVERLTSITTKGEQILVLTEEDASYVAGKRVCLFDDVVSTGGTMKALRRLVERAGGKVVCEAAVWKEGPWYEGELLFADVLPIFVEESKVEELKGALRRDDREGGDARGS